MRIEPGGTRCRDAISGQASRSVIIGGQAGCSDALNRDPFRGSEGYRHMIRRRCGMHFYVESNNVSIRVSVERLGCDYSLSLSGGSKPHVGCAVLAIPRPSLTGEGTSATVSALNRTGHKDDELAVLVAKDLAARTGSVVSCTAGVHFNNITPQIIEEIVQLAPRIVDTVISTREE